MAALFRIVCVFPVLIFSFLFISANDLKEANSGSEEYLLPAKMRFTKRGLYAMAGIPAYHPYPNIKYNPILLGVHYHYLLFNIGNSSRMSADGLFHGGMSVFENDKNGFELGFNLRIGFEKSLMKNFDAGLRIGSGPHYFSSETIRLSDGVVFANHGELTFEKTFENSQKPFSVMLFTGFRHLSNGGREKPNKGLNNIFSGIQWSFFF